MINSSSSRFKLLQALIQMLKSGISSSSQCNNLLSKIMASNIFNNINSSNSTFLPIISSISSLCPTSRCSNSHNPRMTTLNISKLSSIQTIPLTSSNNNPSTSNNSFCLRVDTITKAQSSDLRACPSSLVRISTNKISTLLRLSSAASLFQECNLSSLSLRLSSSKWLEASMLMPNLLLSKKGND